LPLGLEANAANCAKSANYGKGEATVFFKPGVRNLFDWESHKRHISKYISLRAI